MLVCLMVFNATFNNISVISWQSVLLVEETGRPGENHWPVASHWQTLSHNVVHLTLIEIRTHNISGDSCKSNYHTITAMTAPKSLSCNRFIKENNVSKNNRFSFIDRHIYIFFWCLQAIKILIIKCTRYDFLW